MTDSHSTPEWVMDIFGSEDWYDPCPLDDNPFNDGLRMNWKKKTYVNPPYSNVMPWVEKAIEERDKGNLIVMLLNVDTSTKWFAKLIIAGAHFLWFAERLKFSGLGANPRPSMLVVLNGNRRLKHG